MKIEYTNIPKGVSKPKFVINYLVNTLRTWYFFHLKFPWVKYNGFVRVMSHTRFAKNRNITLGNKVQFGKLCSVSTDVEIGNNVLIAARVCFVGKYDHETHIPGLAIWDSPRGTDEVTKVEDDVWIGHGSIILAGVRIGKGAVVAAGSLVTKSIPDCEIWGGVPARKIKDRFNSVEDKKQHLEFLNQSKK